jgi:predicted RNase H-like nuclease (RuvC/YqgF family)
VPTHGVRTIDIEHAINLLRSENAQLKANARTEATNEGTRKKNIEHLQREILKLQEQLLASQNKVYELQSKLLSLREIVNGV